MILLGCMEIMTDAELLAAVEDFLTRSGMAPTRFGREVMSDGALVQHMRAGRSLSLTNANKVLAFIRQQDAARKAAA
jgi:hypothetical protein